MSVGPNEAENETWHCKNKLRQTIERLRRFALNPNRRSMVVAVLFCGAGC
jgi:hypothetical protein